MFIDLHVHYYPEITKDALKMGYSGLVLVKSSKALSSKCNDDKKTPPLPSETPHSLSIFKGIEIRARNPEELHRKIQKFRNKVDVLLVHGGDLKIHRAAVEDPRVDVLSQSYYGRRDSGFNHILARKAAENNVAVEINVGYLLSNHNHRRGKILAQFREILKLKSKYNFPLIITSGARSVYDLRSPRDLMELAACFGMDKETACNALSKVPEDIIYQGQIRNQLILPGVRLLE